MIKTGKHQLILVEGLTGLGKSTMAHFIARQLQHAGIEANWVHEGEDPHPVSVNDDLEIEQFMTASLKRWDTFVSQLINSDSTIVIEASFFNNLIERLFTHGVATAEILEYGLKLTNVIKPANPALVYLTHPDVPDALAQNFRNRGTEFQDFVLDYVVNEPISKENGWQDYDGMMQFWQAFVVVTDSLFHSLTVEKIAVDVSAGEWEHYNRQIATFLGLSVAADPEIDWDTARKFVGHYKFSEDGKAYRIEFENNVLVTDMFMGVRTKLIPRSKLIFLTDKWHFTLNFEIKPDGTVNSFTIGGRDIDYFHAVGMLAKKV